MISFLRHALLLICAVGCASAAASPVRLDFVAGPKIEAYKGSIERNGDWACSGELVTVEVDRMPDSAYMAGDEVHELDEKGQVLRTWAVPLEASPVGIDGPRLIVEIRRAEATTIISIDPEGRLKEVPAPVMPSESAFSKCPATTNLPESGYRWCVSLPDISAAGRQRLIAYEGPCT